MVLRGEGGGRSVQVERQTWELACKRVAVVGGGG